MTLTELVSKLRIIAGISAFDKGIAGAYSALADDLEPIAEQAEADREQHLHLLASALPYVEEAADDPAYKESGKAGIKKLARDIRAAVEAA